MKGSAGILLVAVGLIALYVVLSGKYQCVTDFIGCMTGADFQTSEGFTKSNNAPTIKLPSDPLDQPFLRGVFNPDGSIRLPWNDQRDWIK